MSAERSARPRTRGKQLYTYITAQLRKMNPDLPANSGISVYSEAAQIAGGSVYLNPISRVKLGVGYTINSSNGSTLILNPKAPTGPLAFNYHLPLAALSIDITKRLTYKTGGTITTTTKRAIPGRLCHGISEAIRLRCQCGIRCSGLASI